AGSSWTDLEANTSSTGTTHAHSGLGAGFTRHYRVSAINSVGASSPSNVANATTDAATAPGVPTSLTATSAGRTTINLSWTAPTNDGGAAITGYRIEVSANAGSSWTDLVANTSSTETTYAHSGLGAGTTRHYRVSAINSVGASSPSNVADATTDALEAIAPGSPTSLTATSEGRTTINLSWTAPTNNGGAAITGYRIEVSVNAGSSWTDLEANTSSTGTTYVHSGLGAGTTRHYRVSAINSVGASSPSNVANATTDVVTAPGAPTSLTVIPVGGTTINLSWTAPTNDGGTAITGYRIEVSADTGSSWADLVANTRSTETTYAHRGLGAGTTRLYRVSAINSVGISAPSDIATNTADVPSALSLAGSVGSQVYPIGLPVADLVLPTATGGIQPYDYELSPILPSGLEFDAETRTISGTPWESTARETFTWKVEDAIGTEDTLEFSIEVYRIFFAASIANQSYTRGQSITSLVLPEVIGGAHPIQYTLNLFSLPSGLRFDLPTRTISGTPIEITPPVPFTYRAVDANGAKDSLMFSIEVVSSVNTGEVAHLPQEFIVHGNYPNPFLHKTRLVVDVPWLAQVQVEVMDITGRHVYAKPAVNMTPGMTQEIELNCLTLPSGLYLYRMTAVSLDGNTSSSHVGHLMSIR
ncbi:MAG: T9SS type A sorting domain-containing protein, partial [Rhodothermaceae bacterium]|nr:T9SS type A sorting domain-containing protein [Rhodothermaceae bacterium]